MEKGCTHIVLAYMSGNPDFAGGVDSVVLARAKWLVAHGYRATVVCQGVAGFDQPHTRDDGVHVRPIMVPQLKSHRTGVLHPMIPGRVAAAVLELHGEAPIDLIDIHDGPLGPALKPFLDEFGIASTFTIHSATLSVPRKRRSRIIEGYLVRCEKEAAAGVDLCLPVSESVGSVANYATTRSAEVRVIPNSMSAETMSAGARKVVRTNPDEPLQLLFAARLNLAKGLSVLLDALALLPNRDRVRLSVLGMGPHEAEFRAQTERLGLEEVVTFRGFVSDRREVIDAYLDADVFVLPTRYEALSISALESLACGTPAVLSSIPPNLEAGGDAAFYFPLDDSKALAGIIDALEKDRNQLIELSRKAVARGQVFAGETLMGKLAQAYADAITKNGRRVVASALARPDSEQKAGARTERKIKVSVVILTYNLEGYVADAIRSVLDQTVPADEIFVSDDCSTDRTREIAESFGVNVLTGPKANGNVARNRGARAATGDIILFLDGDDWWHPNKIEAHVAAHGQYPEVSFICDPARVVHVRRMTKKVIARPGREELRWPDLLDWREWASGSCFSVRKEQFARAGGFNEILIALQDVDFWVRAAHTIGPARRLRVPLTYYRVIPKSVSKSPRNVAENLRHLLEGWPFLNPMQHAAFSRHVLLTAGRWCGISDGAKYLALAHWPAHRLKFWKTLAHMGRNTLVARGKS